jgi:chaperonin GroES
LGVSFITHSKRDFVMKKKTKSAKKASKPAKKSAVQSAPKPAQNSVGVAPLGDRVLVKAFSAEEAGTMTAFGILIPDTAKEKPEQGTVMAVGPGKRFENGELMPLSVAVGDTVMFSKYGFDEIKVDGIEYLILPESSILAIIEK